MGITPGHLNRERPLYTNHRPVKKCMFINSKDSTWPLLPYFTVILFIFLYMYVKHKLNNSYFIYKIFLKFKANI